VMSKSVKKTTTKKVAKKVTKAKSTGLTRTGVCLSCLNPKVALMGDVQKVIKTQYEKKDGTKFYRWRLEGQTAAKVNGRAKGQETVKEHRKMSWVIGEVDAKALIEKHGLPLATGVPKAKKVSTRARKSCAEKMTLCQEKEEERMAAKKAKAAAKRALKPKKEKKPKAEKKPKSAKKATKKRVTKK